MTNTEPNYDPITDEEIEFALAEARIAVKSAMPVSERFYFFDKRDKKTKPVGYRPVQPHTSRGEA